MLTLAVTFLATLYLLGPDLLVRWIIGFVAPRRTVERAKFWRDIPGNTFIILGTDIVNMNLLYVSLTEKPERDQVSKNDVEQILKITKQVVAREATSDR